MIYIDGSIGTGGEGQQFFYYLFQKLFYIWEHGDGTMGTAPWERHRGNGTVGTAAIFLLSVSKIFLHRIIEMIYFDGSIGAGGEGQQFFLFSISKNILHLMIQMIYFDGSMGTGA